jgi:sulfite reductase beta subunit-like hemoprotein
MAAEISFDNGNTYYGIEDVQEIAEEVERLGLDTIAAYMDGDTRERCHAESDAETDAEWVIDYLKMAGEDLIIG